MRGRLWLKNFNSIVESRWMDAPSADAPDADTEWTNFMGSVMDEIGKRMKCHVIRKREEGLEALGDMTEAEQIETVNGFGVGRAAISSERLGIDAVFMDEAEYGLHIDGPKGILYGPFALPTAVVELENSWDQDKICYSLWKVLCVRSQVRVVICSQRNSHTGQELRQRLEKVIWESSLMKGTDGDLLVIIGNEEADDAELSSSYYSAFEWRRDSLEKVG